MSKVYEVILDEEWTAFRKVVYEVSGANSKEEAVKLVMENPLDYLADVLDEWFEDQISKKLNYIEEIKEENEERV